METSCEHVSCPSQRKLHIAFFHISPHTYIVLKTHKVATARRGTMTATTENAERSTASKAPSFRDGDSSTEKSRTLMHRP